MNVTLITATVLLIVWILLVFVAQVSMGAVHLLYAGAAILFARRILVGAPSFRS
jgi:hypothetical protein